MMQAVEEGGGAFEMRGHEKEVAEEAQEQGEPKSATHLPESSEDTVAAPKVEDLEEIPLSPTFLYAAPRSGCRLCRRAGEVAMESALDMAESTCDLSCCLQ